jgi:hypothetical protein
VRSPLALWNRPGQSKRENNYFYANRDARSIPLPGKPYMAIRTQRVQE